MNNEDQKDIQARLRELRGQYEALDDVGKVLGIVQSEFKKLQSISSEDRTSHQKLWLLGYAHLNSKMTTGKEGAMVEVARLLPVLAETIS